MNIKIMTYNIRRDGVENTEARKWNSRKQNLLQVITSEDPDILCLEEDQKSQISFLHKELKIYKSFGFYDGDDNRSGEAHSIFYKKDLFKKINSGYFWLSNTPNKKSKIKGQSKYYRTVSYVTLQAGKNKFSIFNIHFDHLSDDVRLREAEILIKLVKKMKIDNYVVCGDFNSNPKSKAFQILHKNFILLNSDLEKYSVTHDWSDVHIHPVLLDYIFSNLKKKSAKVINTKKNESDHFPVVAVVEI